MKNTVRRARWVQTATGGGEHESGEEKEMVRRWLHFLCAVFFFFGFFRFVVTRALVAISLLWSKTLLIGWGWDSSVVVPAEWPSSLGDLVGELFLFFFRVEKQEARGGVSTRLGARLSKREQRDRFTTISMANLESHINLTCMSLRKPTRA